MIGHYSKRIDSRFCKGRFMTCVVYSEIKGLFTFKVRCERGTFVEFHVSSKSHTSDAVYFHIHNRNWKICSLPRFLSTNFYSSDVHLSGIYNILKLWTFYNIISTWSIQLSKALVIVHLQKVSTYSYHFLSVMNI